MKYDKRINIVCGHYGSGKTEFSINLALKLAKEYKTILVDLDVVNVAFRSRELDKYLSKRDIELVSTLYNIEATDIPAVSPKVKKPLDDESYCGIYDLGGDLAGSRSFMSVAHYVDKNNYDLYFICNANRIETSTSKKALDLYKSIENAVGLKITKIVNNTHLISETTYHDVENGNRVALELSEKVGIPLKYVSGTKTILDQVHIPNGAEKFEIELLMRKNWMNIR